MASSVASGLSSGGKVFFGSLCCGTFVLGVWQTQRYYEKIAWMSDREDQLKMAPVTSIAAGISGIHHYQEQFRKWKLSGYFHHQGQVLVGPRSLPSGALPTPKTKNRGVMGDNGGGASTAGPQGYFVVTPFTVTEEDATSTSTRTVMVNRGWIPKEFVTTNTNNTTTNSSSTASSSGKGLWNQPEGMVSITAIPVKQEGRSLL